MSRDCQIQRPFPKKMRYRSKKAETIIKNIVSMKENLNHFKMNYYIWENVNVQTFKAIIILG